MKTIRNNFGSLAIISGLIASLNFVHAQIVTVGSFNGDIMQVQSAQADSIVQVTAEAQGLPLLPPEEVPPCGTFWWVMPGGAAVPAPCPPQDLSAPIYQIADGQFLVDKTGGQVEVVANTRTSSLQAASTVSAVTSALEAQATALVTLITQVQTTAANQQARATMQAMGMDVPFPGDDGGTNSFTLDYSSYTVDYGSNLWVAGISVLSGNLNGTATNTQSGVQYDVMSRTNLLQTDWQYEGTILGSDATNWTPLSVSQNGRPSLFLRLRSNAGDGSGLPSWWQMQYFGVTSGINPNALDFAGDGWSIWQDYVAGYSPLIFRTPPAPKGLTATYNADNTATVNWQLSPGPVTGYTVQRNYYTFNVPPYNQSQTFNVSASTATVHDNMPFTNAYYLGGGWGLSVRVSYRIQAHYAGGDSAWSDAVWLESCTAPEISVVQGPQSSAYLAARNLPVGTTTLRLTRLDRWMVTEFGDSPANAVSFDIPLSSGTNGLYPIPTAAAASPVDAYGYASYQWSAMPVNATGQGTSQAVPLYQYFNGYGFYGGYNSAATGNWIDWIVPPYFDGRVQLKQNLIFLLRGATVNQPFYYNRFWTNQYGNCMYAYSITNPATFAYSGFNNPFGDAYGYVYNGFDVFSPFVNNYVYRNFVYSQADLSGYHPPFYSENSGHIMTGAGGSYEDTSFFWTYHGLGLVAPTYQFKSPTVSGTPIAAVLATNQTQWLATYPMDSPELYYDPGSDSMVSYGYLEEIGVTPSVQTDWETYYNTFETMAANARNLFGLPFLSAKIAYGNSDNTAVETATLSAGSQLENVDGYFYPETAQPQFQTAGYNFWSTSPLPGNDNFSPTSQSDLLMVGVNHQMQVFGYAKLAMLNGYAGAYGYLGQYFDQSYKKDANGNVTTNTTGVLSPYGFFFATEPGLAALVTMPDIDTGARGTGIVSCISLAINKSKSGGMDLSFNGPDATSINSPYVLWANQNFDRLFYDADDSTNYEDDVKAASNPGTSVPQPDCNYSNRLANGYSFRAIPTKRDLEDFTRLWVCGVTSNLLAALPSGSTVTLNWGDVGSPNSGNPTIDLFTAADADGGIGYLTNETVAAIQTNNFQCPYIGRLGPGGSIQLNAIQFANGWAGNHFIWCGVSNGTGGLNLTIAEGNGNVLAQSTAYIQIVDIKQMYERWTVGDNPTNAPASTPILVTDGLAAGVPRFQYTASTDTNTPYILFVHGWNLEPWNKDRFAETAFKRLYWQGYQGRFGEFRWPTDYGFKGTLGQLILNPQEKNNFDNSENFAWQSGVGLLNLLTSLNTEYPGHVYVLAHSMGNIVTGEALRLAGSNQVVNTYVASQAAVTAHTYDNTIANYSFNRTINGIPISFGPYTPNIYGNWFAGNNGGGAGKVVNLYNTNDYALSQLHWQVDQLTKPDSQVAKAGMLWDYHYNGSPNDPAPWNHFYKQDTNSTVVNFDIVNNLNNRYEVMAYAAQAYTTALGATPGVHNIVDVDLTRSSPTRIWPPDNSTTDPNKKYAAHFWHSAEFRGDYAPMQGYWSELLGSEVFNLK